MTAEHAAVVEAIREVQRREGVRDDRSRENDWCEPGERVIAESDLEAMADAECGREERWRESA